MWPAMRVLRSVSGNLQAHILSLFSLMLFASFLIIGFTFNFAVHRYITSGAEEALGVARDEYQLGNERHFVSRFVFGGDSFFSRTVPYFELNHNYEILSLFYTRYAVLVADYLVEENVTLAAMDLRRVRSGDQTMYISIVPENNSPSIFVVFYLDVTEILQFSTLVNRLLLLLGAFVWLIAIVVSGIVSDLLVRPLRKLRDFVFQIGKGDFTPNDFKFASEEMQELNQSLNNAAIKLAGYDNDQKTFFQNVSHDLRTPLMAIKSYSEGIKYGIMDPLDASETIIKAADRLTGMVDDIMYVSRLDSLAVPKMGRDNLSEIVAERIMQHREYAKSIGLSIKFSSSGGSLIIVCATQYIERAVDNLISNALRHAKSWVKIECRAIGNRVILVVSDDGPGFEKDALPHVFERFYRSKNGMTGIGLSIVKSIADQHKATATAENGEDGGAVLTISFPRHRV